MTKYDQYLQRARHTHGEKFSAASLDPRFVPFFNNGDRVKVGEHGETVTGTIGVTTGWAPVFLLMRSSRAEVRPIRWARVQRSSRSNAGACMSTSKPVDGQRRTYGGRLQLSKGYSQYGADMGRVDETPPVREEHERPRLHLRRVPIDSGGYDPGGAYWGFAEPLYQVSGWINNEEDRIEYYLRASTRDGAKAKVRDRYPDARFYR